MTAEEFEVYFQGITLTTEPVYLTPAEKVTDLKLMINSHITQLKNYPDSKISIPFRDRLMKLIEILEEK